MDTREMKEIEAAVEGILFASGEPVAVDRICVALDMDRPTVEHHRDFRKGVLLYTYTEQIQASERLQTRGKR